MFTSVVTIRAFLFSFIMDIQEIQETLKYASDYLVRLKNLRTELDGAEQQIESTALETEENIKKLINKLISSVTGALITRQDELLGEIAKIRKRESLPLAECRKVVEKKIQSTNNLISLGNDLLKSDANAKKCVKEFSSKSSLLGSLPEVPHLKEVPYISFQCERNCEKELIKACTDVGSVIHIAPVQISTLTEKPGAILVEWSTSENDDRVSDIQEYHLQKAFGNVYTEKHLRDSFRTCYMGADNQCLIKDLVLDQDYTFRVCCKFEGEAEWSPWSLPQSCSTKLKPFYWNTSEHFILTNESKIATPSNNSSSILFSIKSKFDVGYSVEFTFLECDNNLSETYVGLFISDDIQESKITDSESVCVEANGNIYGSGMKKSTQFPPVRKGTKICFTCELKDQNKLRMNIDSSGKRVTYDWLIDGNAIYFGARFNSPKWKIMID